MGLGRDALLHAQNNVNLSTKSKPQQTKAAVVAVGGRSASDRNF